MKVEWLNQEFTRAQLTKGWVIKKTAIVVEREDYWYFEETGQFFVHSLWSLSMAERRERDRNKSPWRRVVPLPPMRVREVLPPGIRRE